MKFAKGQHVRQRGKHLVMEVVGDAGLAATAYAVVARREMVACAWRTPQGKRSQRIFAEADLEAVAPSSDGSAKHRKRSTFTSQAFADGQSTKPPPND